jgi:hypothetical protein
MKLRNMLPLVAAFVVGYELGKRASRDDPNVVKGPRPQQPAGLRTVSAQAQRLADAATTKSVDALRRARGAIRHRLSDHEMDDATWN